MDGRRVELDVTEIGRMNGGDESLIDVDGEKIGEDVVGRKTRAEGVGLQGKKQEREEETRDGSASRLARREIRAKNETTHEQSYYLVT